jgi:3-hydroxyacyl-CoA dehydrogenase
MANSLDVDIVMLLNKTIELVKTDYKALVIYNEGPNFSVGANLGLALFAANIAGWNDIQALVGAGQFAYRALKYAPFPVVAAPAGMALGGGCEILLHSDAIQAHAETYAGLVEVGVGLIPAWGGCKEMLARWRTLGKLPKGPLPAVAKVFEYISTATVAKSAAEAKEMLILRPDDGITMNRYRLLADAKAKALALVENYAPPEPPTFVLPGPSGRVALNMAVEGFARLGKATKHDVVVSGALAEILTGGDTDLTETITEDRLLELEREGFMKLIRHPDTLARIEHMLETGKPLRN